MHNNLWFPAARILALVVFASPTLAETVDSSSLPIYVTRNDCNQLIAHHPDASVAYQPGVDVHGHYVAPADLPSSPSAFAPPDHITFDLKVNPLAYGAQQAPNGAGPYANNAATIAHVEVDTLSGALKVNGHPVDSDQSRALTDACRKAGYK